MARRLTENEIEIASRSILEGSLVAIPTETVYGLAGNALDPLAVAKIFAAKERPSFDPLIVHVSSQVRSVDDLAAAGILDTDKISVAVKNVSNQLIKKFWPGPLTIILPKGPLIPDIVTSGLSQVGVRMPAHPVAQALLKKCHVPLAAPSANRFGRISPTTPAHVEDELGDKIPFILDGGACEIGVESTVVTISENQTQESETTSPIIWLIRPGKITSEELQSAVSCRVEFARSEHEKASPGMLLSHYAPHKTMISLKQLTTQTEVLRKPNGTLNTVALLVVSGNGQKEIDILKNLGIRVIEMVTLSDTSNETEAAKNLFASMRRLDQTDADFIITTETPNCSGLWLAIHDRLKRACTSSVR